MSGSVSAGGAMFEELREMNVFPLGYHCSLDVVAEVIAIMKGEIEMAGEGNIKVVCFQGRRTQERFSGVL